MEVGFSGKLARRGVRSGRPRRERHGPPIGSPGSPRASANCSGSIRRIVPRPSRRKTTMDSELIDQDTGGLRLSPAEIVATYFSVWNELDAVKRERALEQVWAADGVLIQPRAGRVEGRSAVLRHIAGLS